MQHRLKYQETKEAICLKYRTHKLKLNFTDYVSEIFIKCDSDSVKYIDKIGIHINGADFYDYDVTPYIIDNEKKMCTFYIGKRGTFYNLLVVDSLMLDIDTKQIDPPDSMSDMNITIYCQSKEVIDQ